MILVSLLFACTSVVPTAKIGSDKVATGSIAEQIGDTGEIAEIVVEETDKCYELDSIDGWTGCYKTRPFFTIDTADGPVSVSDDEAVIGWNIEIEAAPERWIGVNNLGLWLNLHDESGSGWTSDVWERLSYVDQYGDEHGIGVQSSNPGGKTLAIGEIVSAEGDWAVPTIEGGDTVIVTIELDLEGIEFGEGDAIHLDLLPYQSWSSAETSSTQSEFGGEEGTTFLFE